ncbi:MAG: ribosome maturation factor RimP, partial [Deltaproteobacteria bacterium]|nr:ribosome maturation factor RimP [Deltaproteobacteria bacterium]
MSFSNIEEGCGKLVTPLLNELGLELVDVEFKTESGRKILRVFIDKPEG